MNVKDRQCLGRIRTKPRFGGAPHEENNMINALHLFWIIPVSAGVGAFVLAIFKGGDCDPVWYDDPAKNGGTR